MADKAYVLLVEDSVALARLYVEYLKQASIEPDMAGTGKEALALIEARRPDLLLLDLNLPDMNGLDILKLVTDRTDPITTVVITAHGSVSVAVEAMKAGAYDFMVKPFAADRLLITVRNALERLRLARLVDAYREGFARDSYGGFIGRADSMQAVYRSIDSAARSKATIFITGESGTGKEVCAEAIHKHSPRAEGPLVVLNCAAIPKELMESEIFGHVRGAFTGATADREGAASRAHRGTLFLDEICEMQLDLQAKLLRFIQTGTYQPVGGTAQRTVDVRFICATNRTPWTEVQEGRFREDLYYRLHVIPICLPPLRERDGDVLLIARHFLHQYAAEEGKGFDSYTPDAEAAICAYAWPGNIRQLQNIVRQIVVMNTGDLVTRSMLPPPLDETDAAAPERNGEMSGPPEEKSTPEIGIEPLWVVEKRLIEQAISRCDGNIPKAAAALEISASTIYRKRMSWESS